MKKDVKGITLIALVITIIVLLILAAVSIAMLTGENGLLQKATKAKEENKLAQAKEQINLMLQEYRIERDTGSNKSFKNFLQEKKNDKKIDGYEKNENYNENSTKLWDIELDGYFFTVDEDPLKILLYATTKVRPKASVEMITNGYVLEGNIVQLKITIELPEELKDAVTSVNLPDGVTKTDEGYSVSQNGTYEIEVIANKDGADYKTTLMVNIANIIEKPNIEIPESEIKQSEFVVKVTNSYPTDADLNYKYYIGETEKGSSKERSCKITGLASSTQYKVKVRVYIGDNTEYKESEEKTVTTKGIEINSIEGLEKINESAQTLAGKYELAKDLDFKDRNSYETDAKYNYYNADANNDGTPDNSWTPIGSTSSAFKGNFDGQNHTISNLYINTTKYYSGLFGYSSNSTTFKNIKLSNVNINSTNFGVGALVGQLEGGTIYNVHLDTANIKSSSSDVGGIAGQMNWGTASKLEVTNASITGSKEVGGIVGYASAESTLTIEQAVFNGNVYGSYSGGIIGYPNYTKVNISNSYTTGYSKVAGISGYKANSISNCYTTMKVGSYPIASISSNTEGVFWNSSTAGVSSSRYGTPKTTGELQQASTFAGWDTSIWNIEDGKYPTLKWEQ